MSETFVLIKPDGVKRNIVGEIIKRLEQKNFVLDKITKCVPNRTIVEQHYNEHMEQPFF